MKNIIKKKFKKSNVIIISIFLIPLWFGFLASFTYAEEEKGFYQPLNEVFQTETVYPQEEGEVQMQLSPTFSEGNNRKLFTVPLSIEYGITDFWQIGFEWDSHVIRTPDAGITARGSGDIEVSTKYSFMNISDSSYHVAVGLEIGFAAGNVNKELTEGFNEYEPFLILAKDFPRFNNSQVFTRLSVGFADRKKRHEDPDEDEIEANEFSWDIGVFVPVGPIRLTTEFNWRTNEWHNSGDENQIFLTPGIVWDLPGTWEWGLGAPIGLNDKTDNYRVITQLIYEFDLY